MASKSTHKRTRSRSSSKSKKAHNPKGHNQYTPKRELVNPDESHRTHRAPAHHRSHHNVRKTAGSKTAKRSTSRSTTKRSTSKRSTSSKSKTHKRGLAAASPATRRRVSRAGGLAHRGLVTNPYGRSGEKDGRRRHRSRNSRSGW